MVKGQLDELMSDFEPGRTPPWAAGAMRAANAAMAARGLGASSMAGMAVVQAAMESALPIAQMDAANKVNFQYFSGIFIVFTMFVSLRFSTTRFRIRAVVAKCDMPEKYVICI